jgi:hypothetical protein
MHRRNFFNRVTSALGLAALLLLPFVPKPKPESPAKWHKLGFRIPHKKFGPNPNVPLTKFASIGTTHAGPYEFDTLNPDDLK